MPTAQTAAATAKEANHQPMAYNNAITCAIPRPYSEWLIYFQLERNYIHQKIFAIPSSHKRIFDPHDPSYLALFSSHTGPPLPLPRRYEGIVLPEHFYTVYKDDKEKRKKHDDAISLQDLSNMVSKNWESADAETKEYVQVMHRIDIEEYQRRYDESCIISRQEAEDGELEEMTQNDAEERNQKMNANYDKETDAKEVTSKYLHEFETSHNEMNSNIISIEKHIPPTQNDNDSAGLKNRIAESDIGADVPVNKRLKWPYEQNHYGDMDENKDATAARSHTVSNASDCNQEGNRSTLRPAQFFNAERVANLKRGFHNHQNNHSKYNNIMETNKDVVVARSRAFDSLIKCSMRNGNHTALQSSQRFNPPMMVNPYMAFKTYNGDVREGKGANNSNKSHSCSSGNMNCPKYDANVRPQPCPPRDVFYTPLIEQFNNKGEVALDKYDPQSYPSVCRGTGTIAMSDNSARCAASSGSSHSSRTGARLSQGSSGLNSRSSGISELKQQGGGKNDAIKRIHDDISLTDEEVRLLLHRGAKGIAEDAARSVNGKISRPCPAATKAAIKFFEGQKNNCPPSKGATLRGNSGDLSKDGTWDNPSTQPQPGQLSAIARSNIATIAAAATAAGMRILPPSEVNNRGSKEEGSVNHHGNANIDQPKKSEALSPIWTASSIPLPPSTLNNRGSKEEVGVGQNGNVSIDQPKKWEALSTTSTPTWTARHMLINTIRSESNREVNSAFQLQQNFLIDVMMKNQQLQTAMDAKNKKPSCH